MPVEITLEARERRDSVAEPSQREIGSCSSSSAAGAGVGWVESAGGGMEKGEGECRTTTMT